MERSKPKAKGKNEKLFRFQSFTERIASIKINVMHQTRTTAADAPDESETFFGCALQKWRELNCTSGFVEFHGKVVGYSNSLPQIVHHKDEILAALCAHLQSSDTLAHEPLLDCVVQLARDLQGDFYPHFTSIFPVLVSICLCHDPQLIQNGFSAIAHIFKFLWRHMLKDIENVYSLYSELLVQTQKPHIRQFAAESFGFLLRKVRDQEKLLGMIFTSLSDNPELVEGVGQLIFEVCKGVSKQFHSCADKVLGCSLEILTMTSSPSLLPLSPDLVFSSLSHTVQLMVEHTRRDFSTPLWSPLMCCLEELVRSRKVCPDSIPLTRNLDHILHLVGVAVAWRQGSRIRDSGKIAKILEEVISPSLSLTPSLLSTILHLVTSLLLVGPHVPECHAHSPRLLWLLCSRGGCEEVETVLKCFRELSEKHPSFVSNILPECVKYCDIACGSRENHTHIIHYLTELCLTFYPKWAHPHSETPAGNFRTPQPPSLRGRNFVLEVEWGEGGGRVLRSGSGGCGVKKLVTALEGVVVRGAGVVGVVASERAESEESGRGYGELANTWAALVCVEHLSSMPRTLSEAVKALVSNLTHALKKTTPTDTQSHAHQAMVWCQAVCTLTSAGCPLPLSRDDLIPLLQNWPTSPHVLTAVETYLKQLHPSSSSSSTSLSTPHLPPLSGLLPLLLPNLSSPSSHVRVLTLKVIMLCLPCDTSNAVSDTADAIDAESDAESDAGAVDSGRSQLAKMVEFCLKAEQAPAILTKYREKLLWVEKLKYNPNTFKSFPSFAHEIPLRFLIGSLYVNFSLLWEPIKHLVISYAVDERKKLFWDVIGHFLEKSSHISDTSANVSPPPSESLNWHDSISALFQFQYSLVCGMERGRPDHTNFRRLLWDTVADVSSFAEPRSRILVPLFLQFIEREYALREDNLMEFQDLRNSPEDDNFEEEGAKDGEERGVMTQTEVGEKAMEEEEEEEEEGGGERKNAEGGEIKSAQMKNKRKKKDKGTEKKQSGSRGLTKILLAMLQVFSKFTNPKVLYRQEDLHNLYMKLLAHRDTEVQQLAIDCLLTYKTPYLVHYHENLGRLMENASFREELLKFNTDSESCVVAEEHRAGLMPALLRILYGRIQRPVGVAMSRVGVASRRMAVLQFLAGCREREVDEFFSLLLLPFRTLLDLSDDLVPEVDIGRVIPLRKQLGFLRMLSMILAVLGPRVEPHLATFLSLLLGLGHQHRTMLDHYRHQIQPVFVSVIKSLRQLVVARLIECFKTFTSYDFSPFEDRIFGTTVWPQLVKLPNESIQHPTPLMKLLTTWSKFPRYHRLLSRSIPEDLHIGSPTNTSSGGQEFTPGVAPILHYVYQCLFSPGVSGRVTACVMEMTLDLLECADEDGGEGVSLVLGHVPTLLAYLGGRVRSKCERTAEGEGGNLQLEFNVLSRISNHVNDSEECATLASLLLPFVSANKYKKQQESILIALKNLLASVEDANSFLRPLSKLFGELTCRQNRKLLCVIFQVLAKKDGKWKKTADIVSMVNEWDAKHIEEPAYETRQEGYAAASGLLASETNWTVDCILPVLHNAIYTLNTSSEMSLRDAGSSFITCLLSHIATDDGEKFDYLVMNVVVTAVKRGLRSKHEFARLEFISILSSLVKCYPHHPRFIDMATHLANDDKETDFFENIRHLQLHRQTKAMRKLAAACKCGQLSPHSMTGFLAPLANQVLFHSTSNVEQNLLTESVNVISGMCLQLKWTKYCYFLRHNLRLLTKKSDVHKTLIRVVVGILDSFHFDVSGTSSDTSRESEREKGGEDGGREIEGAEEEMEKGEEDKEEMEEEEGENEKAPQSPSLQRKIHDTLVKSILPSFAAVLTKGSSPTPAHKLSSKSNDSEANMLRVPVAMAMTKLLLHLPRATLATHLPSLLLKVCETLKSRSHDVRDVARDTLVKMAATLGPTFLPYVFKEMKDLLTRGYQLHVLAYSLHSVLNGVRPILKTGDLDPCLDLISQVLVADLFGVPAEEREAGESVAKIPEGKNPQSSKSYGIMAGFLSPRLLPQLLTPVKEILEAKASSRTTRVAEEVLRQIGYGILSNDGLTPQALLVFVHSLVSDAVPRLSVTKPHPPSVAMMMHSSSAPPPRRPEDCRLILKEPGRARPKPASQSNVAAHVITEFGLQVLRAAFKKGKFDSSSTEHLQMLDPFLPLLTLSLASRHTKVLTHSLHCLLPLLRLPLPSLDGSVHRLVAALFGVLRKYARSGEMSGTNRELVIAAFKAMTVVLRDVKRSEISEDELKLLLSYVEEDIHDYRRQITAFPLLRAILGRKFVVEDIHKLMYKVAQLSVMSDSDTTRLQCRQSVVHYIMDYPLGKKLKKILDFYVCNLSYEDQNGRESIVEFFSLIFSKFPDLLVHRFASFFFLPLSAQLANDDSPTVKRMIAETLSSLFKRLNSAAMNDVIAMVKTWLSHAQLSHKKLAVQLVALLAESQGRPFEAHLPTFLPLLSECLLLQHQYPDVEEEPVTLAMEESVTMENGAMEISHVSKQTNVESRTEAENGINSDNEEGLTLEDESENETAAVPDERSLDHFLFGAVHVLCKVLTTCSALRSPVHRTLVTDILEQVESLLLHPHAWVRLATCQLFGHLFAAYKPQELAAFPETMGEEEAALSLLSGERESGKGGGRKRKRRKSGVGVAGGVVSEYLLMDPISKVPELCHKFCVQLGSHLLTPELANQAVKNLVFVAKVLHRLMEAGHMTSSANHVTDHMTHNADHMSFKSNSTTTDCDDESERCFAISEDKNKHGTTTEDTYEDHCGSTGDHNGHRTMQDLHWLVGRMDRLARQEAGKTPHQALKRTSVLQWMAALSLDLGPAHLPSYLPVLLATPYRELTDPNRTAGEGLHTLASEVVEVMKETCGKEEFSRAYSVVHRRALDTREKRKKHAALEAVINPEKAIRRRQRKHVLTRASKRRRILTHRPSATAAAKRFRHITRK